MASVRESFSFFQKMPNRFSGRHFLQIPGPTNIPDPVLQSMARPTIDHRGPEFADLSKRVQKRLQGIFQTSQPVLIFPSSGTGAWEAALVNTLSPGDQILMFETGYFAQLWKQMAERLDLVVDWIAGNWRSGVDPNKIEERLQGDRDHHIKAVAVVHNETSTGVTSQISEIREAIDRCDHPALLMVDTISSLASIDYRHEDWNIDVAVGASQKGLMLPPGLGFNAVSHRALQASKNAKLPRSYWDWGNYLELFSTGFFPYTPATNLIYGLDVALDLLLSEGLEKVFARHRRLAEATRIAVNSWNLEIMCQNPVEYSESVTGIFMPDGHNADKLRKILLDRFDIALGTGLGRMQGRTFRIGHLGDFNDLMLAGTLSGIEMGLLALKVPFHPGGVQAALDFLATHVKP